MREKVLKYREQVQSKIFFRMVLARLGLNNKYAGFYYMVELLDIVLNQGVGSRSLYKNAYPMMDEFFNVSDLTIERNIRHMLKQCWNDSMAEKLKPYWNERVRPTCKKFLKAVSDYIIHLVNDP